MRALMLALCWLDAGSMLALCWLKASIGLTASPGKGLRRPKGVLLWVAKPAPLAGEFRGLANEHPAAKTGGASPLQTRDQHGKYRGYIVSRYRPV